jgi:hypothetical protein
MKTTTQIRKGIRVRVTGIGRTARWPKTSGTVTMVRRGYVYVAWDGTSFEDEMTREEVEVAA